MICSQALELANFPAYKLAQDYFNSPAYRMMHEAPSSTSEYPIDTETDSEVELEQEIYQVSSDDEEPKQDENDGNDVGKS